ncbi:Holliday junction resolvase RuvX [Castellaniella sp.]|uniref:Holliday junction resolvase RuvX n=1 Tax=Castellaniella sp. TaxID=1955812 RepID=UPI00355CDFFC
MPEPGAGPGVPAPPEVLLGFDFGLKKIGVALGNTLTAHARPLCILRPLTRQQRFDQIAHLLQAWQPDRVIVGLPLTLAGEEQPASGHSRRFARQLEGRFRVPVELVDERGSSLEAQGILGTHADDDAMAAAVILQRWLDRAG